MANIIAVVWDFDKTLVNGYMQDPIFHHYQVDGKTFWQEVYQPADGMISSREAHREIMKEDFIMRELNARRQIGMLLVETESFLIFLTWIKEFFRHIDPEAYMQFEQKRKH
mgnify:CR=1 FL=1